MRLAAGRPRWWIGFALTDLPSLPFSAGAIMCGLVLYRSCARPRAFSRPQCFPSISGRRLHLSWESCSGFDTPRRVVVVDRGRVHDVLRSRACARCCHLCRRWASLVGPPLHLSWLCVACDAARGTREGLAARRMRDRLRYHVGSRARRGQPLGAEVLLVVPTAGRNPFRGKASCLLARARSQNTATADPDVDRNTVTGLRVRRTNRPHNTPPNPSPCGWIASLCDA